MAGACTAVVLADAGSAAALVVRVSAEVLADAGAATTRAFVSLAVVLTHTLALPHSRHMFFRRFRPYQPHVQRVH